MAKSDSASQTVSPESIACLKDAMKGQVRKFVMLCKGPTVVSLVVFKKGSVDSRKKEAKEGGSGQVCFGVVDGKGQEIRFVLTRADGFEREPTKSSTLKSFLDEAADFKCKPYFEIVDVAPVALDLDDPLVARFVRLRDAAQTASETYPDRAAELNTLCSQIAGDLDQEQPEPAAAKCDQLEALLGGLGGSTATVPGDSAGLEAKLAEALKKFQPLLVQALERQPARKGELLAAVAKARDEIKQQRFGEAQAGILALGKLLQSLLATKPDASATDSEDQTAVADEQALFKKRLAALTPAIKLAAETNAGDQARSRAIKAVELAGGKKFGEAHGQLDRVEVLLNVRPSSEPEEKPDFPRLWQVAKTAWEMASETVDGQISQLQQALKQTTDSDLQEIAEFGLNAITAGHKVQLLAAIQDVDRSAGETLVDAAIGAQGVIEEFLEHLQSDERVRACDANPFKVRMSVAATLSKALKQMDVALEAVEA